MENDNPQPAPAPQQIQPLPPSQPTNQPPRLPSAFDLIKPSWEAIRLNIQTFLLLAIFPVLAAILYAIYASRELANTGPNDTAHVGGFFLTLLILTLVIIVIEPMFMYTVSKSSKGEKVSLDQAISGGFKFFFRLIGLGIVVAIHVIIGLILLIIPGVFMIKRFLLSPYIMVDGDLSISDTVKQAKVISKQYSGPIWGVLGVTALIGCVSIIPIIGSIISGVLGLIYNAAPAIRYEQIKHLGTTAAPIAPKEPITNPMPPNVT